MNFTGKVLLADDEPHIRKFMGLLLRKLGCTTVLEAGDGGAVLTLYAQHKPDLVLLDVNMPGVDGVQALARLRQTAPEAIVVMLTSLANRQTVEECLRLGATDYLRKDLPPVELLAHLQGIIEDCFSDEAPSVSAP